MATVNLNVFTKPSQIRQWLIQVADIEAERIARRLAGIAEASIKMWIMNTSKMPTGALADAFFKEQTGKYSWGIGKIEYLNENTPYWRHCLSDDTEVYVWIDNKLIPMSLNDLFDVYIKNKGIQILTPHGLKKIINMRELFEDKYYNFQFSSFYNVKMSAKHRLIYKVNSGYIEKTADSFGKAFKVYSGLYSTLNQMKQNVIKSITIDNKTLKLDYLYGWIIGFTLADGCVSSKNRVVWGQKHINRIYDKINNFCLLFDYKIKVSKDKYLYRLVANNKLIKKFISRFCIGVKNKKKIQNFYLNTPEDFRKGILDGYNEGDGRKADTDKYHVRTISMEMRNQLVLIGASLGYDFSILKNREPKESIIDERTVKSQYTMFNAYIYTYGRRWHVTKNKCLTITKPKSERKRTKKGTFQIETGKPVNISYFPKSLTNIKMVNSKIRLIDIAVDGELFLINGGLVSHNSNYGSEAINANWQHRLPKGHWENGRWIEGDGPDDYFAIPNTPIQAHNYIEKTIADLEVAIQKVISEGK